MQQIQVMLINKLNYKCTCIMSLCGLAPVTLLLVLVFLDPGTGHQALRTLSLLFLLLLLFFLLLSDLTFPKDLSCLIRSL